MNAWVYLGLAIVSELLGSSALKASAGLSRLIPSLGVMVDYAAAFTFLSFTLKALPLGLTYSVWAGVGTAGTVLLGVVLFDEVITTWHLLAVGLILTGVVLLYLLPRGTV